MRADNDENWRPKSLEFNDDRLQPLNHVGVGFTFRVTVTKLVAGPGREFIRHLRLDFLVGEAVAHARIDLVESAQRLDLDTDTLSRASSRPVASS